MGIYWLHCICFSVYNSIQGSFPFNYLAITVVDAVNMIFIKIWLYSHIVLMYEWQKQWREEQAKWSDPDEYKD